jgi:hypothetical protein
MPANAAHLSPLDLHIAKSIALFAQPPPSLLPRPERSRPRSFFYDERIDMSARPFADLLREQRRGSMHDELTAKLHELVNAVESIGKPGKLVLTIDIRKYKNDTGGVIEVSDDVELKLPKPDRPTAIWFTTADGNLSKTDPAQKQMPLTEVKKPQAQEIA